MKTAPDSCPPAVDTLSAQMGPEVSIVSDYSAGDAALAAPGGVLGTATIGRDDLKASRPARSALRTGGASHNSLVRTTQSRLSRG